MDKEEKSIIDGKVTVKNKKPSLLNVLLYDSTDVIAKRGIKEIIIPRTKQMLLSLVALALNGDSNSGYSGYNYRYGSSSIPYVDAYGRQQQMKNNTARKEPFKKDQIILYSRSDAERIINMIHQAYEKYHVVSMGTLYRWIGQDPPHTYDRYGWATDSAISRCDYKTSIDGNGNEIYILVLPTPSVL